MKLSGGLLILGLLGASLAAPPLSHAADILNPGAWAEMPGTMRIDNADDLELIRQTRPEHYKKIRKILADIQDQVEGKVGKWMQTTFDAREVSYEPMLLVSLPPQRRLSFKLDDTRYAGVIVLTNYQAQMTP